MSPPSTPPPPAPAEIGEDQMTGRSEQPSTPPNPVAHIKLTLPTPPSFAAHRRTQSITSSPSSNTGSPQRQPKRGHHRSVSFSQDVEVKTMSPENKAPLGGLYRIPQRNESDESSMAEVSPRTRKGPPSALALGSRSSKGFNMGSGQLLSPFSRGPKTAPVQSRFATTAAARGLSIAPALAKLKDKTTPSLPGIKSIWSAGATSTGGWITPGLASAKSVTPASATTARQRGLSVAVLKDGKEMLVDSGPITPGLPSARRKSFETSAPLSAKSEALLSPASRPQSANQTKEGKRTLPYPVSPADAYADPNSDPLPLLPYSRIDMYIAAMPIRTQPLRPPTLTFSRRHQTANAVPHQNTRLHHGHLCSSSGCRTREYTRRCQCSPAWRDGSA